MSISKIKVLLMSPVYDDPGVAPPFGVAYLSGFLRDQSSVELTVVDSAEFSLPELKEMVAYGEYAVFATGGYINCFQFCRDMFELSATMRPDAKRIVGGPLTVFNHDLLFQVMAIDAAVLGEGEETFSELLDVLRSEQALVAIKGIAYRHESGRISVNEPRPPIDIRKRDLKPDWTFVNMERYITYPNPNTEGFLYNRFDSSRPYRRGFVMAGRGCPFRCKFCGSPLGRFRRRANEKIVEEMRRWRDQYRVDHITFVNETLLMRPRDVEALCKMMIDEKLNLHWSCDLRVDAISRESLKLMKEAGCCVYVNYGIESGSDRVLKRMNKGTTVEQNRTALNLTREAGIYPHVSIMFGYRDETLEDIKKTVDLMIEANELPESLAITTAIPGTELYRELISKGLIKNELEYVEKFCDEMSKGLIYGERKPILNITKIPDEIFWQSLLGERRRLYTEHFLRNRAVLSSVDYCRENVHLQLACPHCHAPFGINVCIESPKISKHFCRQCLHYIWVDPFLIPEFEEHFTEIECFLQRIENEEIPLILYDASQLYQLFKLDPWDKIWRNATSIIGVRKKFYYFEVVPPKHAARLASSAVLIAGTDATNTIRKRLLRQGFHHDNIITLFPTMPLYSSRQLVLRLKHFLFYKDPATRKLYKYLRSTLNSISVRKKYRQERISLKKRQN